MRTKDMLRISAGNLRRLKLRSTLTISGIVIAIGAFVTMLSFWFFGAIPVAGWLCV